MRGAKWEWEGETKSGRKRGSEKERRGTNDGREKGVGVRDLRRGEKEGMGRRDGE